MRHFVIGDTQCKPNQDLSYLKSIGNYIVAKQPEVIIHLGDHWDMESLSSYEKRGSKYFEGKRYVADIKAGNEGMRYLLEPIKAYNQQKKKNKEKQYKPRLVYVRGNHEHRCHRAVSEDPKLEGLIGYHDMDLKDWEVYDFLEMVEINGVHYSHYFYNPMSGKPWGGKAHTMLNNIGFSFVQGHRQGKDIAEKHLANGKTIRGLILGSCLTPDHKVLTSDLRYVELGSINAGDTLVSFDEEQGEKRSRRYKKGTVLNVRRKLDKVYGVTLSNGKMFKATSDHRWLRKTGSLYNWCTTSQLRMGTVIPKLFDEWECDNTNDCGYIGGIYDGEGSLYIRQTTGGNSTQLSLSQKEGYVLDKCENILKKYGFDCTKERPVEEVRCLRIKGGQKEIARALGTFRPVRLLNKFTPDALGSIYNCDADNPKVASIEYLGEKEVVEIDIDAQTMIVEGYPHHNCYLHDEDYKGPQANKHFRGCAMLHEVNDGDYNLMELSLDYLMNKWG